MVCVPYAPGSAKAADAFGMTSDQDLMFVRTFENLATLMTAPWRAWWALAFEAMDSRNYAPEISRR